MMGIPRIPIDGPAWLFGDNKSMVALSTEPQSTLNRMLYPITVYGKI
jgi:hypothetical protein